MVYPERQAPDVTVKLQVMKKTKKGGKSPLGEKISTLAAAQGFAKPSDFAHANGINLGTFNDLLYGKTRIYPESLIAVAKGLGVEPWTLLSPTEPLEFLDNRSSQDSEDQQNRIVSKESQGQGYKRGSPEAKAKIAKSDIDRSDQDSESNQISHDRSSESRSWKLSLIERIISMSEQEARGLFETLDADTSEFESDDETKVKS